MRRKQKAMVLTGQEPENPLGAAERDMISVSRAQRSPQQWSCQRALTVRGNVAVDIEACSLDGPTDAAAAIAGAIGERLPAA